MQKLPIYKSKRTTLLGICSFAILHALAVAQPEPAGMQIFILAGQSNMAGRGHIEEQDKVPHERVYVLTKGMEWQLATDPLHFDKPIAGTGMGKSFGAVLAESDPNVIVGLVPVAVGGSTIDQWLPNQTLYREMLRRAVKAAERGKIVGILWHQGESDSAQDRAAAYLMKFQRFSRQIREDLGLASLPIIVGETGKWRKNGMFINAALALIPDHIDNCAFVSSEGLQHTGDSTHFDAASQREFGRRYALAWQRLQTKPQ